MADSSLDVGTLSGRIEFEDHVSSTLDLIMHRVGELEEGFGGLGHRVAESAEGFIIAEVALDAMKEAIHGGVEMLKELSIEGGKIAGVENNFERLNEQAGRLSSTLLTSLKEGTHSTITDFELMKIANKDLAAGMNLTDGQFKTLSQGAFALAKATGTDVASALETMNQAMLTGRTRAVAMLTGKIDLAAAERDFAAKLGITADHLTAEGKLQAAREAILNAVGKATGRLGEQTVGLDDKIAALQVGWKNWYEELAKSVATSPHVVTAFDTIRDAILGAFGGDTDSALETVTGWINYLADQVTNYGPVVVQSFVNIKDWILDVYHTVVDTWDALPDWLKHVAEASVLASVGVLAIDTAAGAASSGLSDLIGVASNTTQVLTGIPALIGMIGGAFVGLKEIITVMDFSSLVDAGASLSLLGESALAAIGPLGQVALVAAAIMAAWEVGKMEVVSDFFEKIGLRIQGYSSAEADAMIQTDHLTQAAAAQANALKEQEDASKKAADLIASLKAAHEGATVATHEHNAEDEKAKFIMTQTADEAKKYAEALKEMNTAGEGWQGTLDTLDGEMVESIKYYLEAGVAQDKLATAYGLTATQIDAVSKSLKDEQENLKLEKKQLDDSIGRWAEYYNTQIEMGGTAFDKEVAQIEGWKAKQIESHATAKTDTADFYDWLAARESQMYAKADQDRLQGDEHSKASLDKKIHDAEEYYNFMMAHSDQYTQRDIANEQKIISTLQEMASNWGNVGGAIDKDSEKVRTLSGEVMTLKQYEEKQLAGGSSQITSYNFDQVMIQSRVDLNVAHALAKLGYSAQEIITYTNPRLGNGPIPPPQGPRIPGFREGGIGDFGDGTLAMLHGKEAVIPLDGAHGGIGPNIQIFVNGTAADVARKVGDEIMRQLKQHRQFGAA